MPAWSFAAPVRAMKFQMRYKSQPRRSIWEDTCYATARKDWAYGDYTDNGTLRSIGVFKISGSSSSHIELAKPVLAGDRFDGSFMRIYVKRFALRAPA